MPGTSVLSPSPSYPLARTPERASASQVLLLVGDEPTATVCTSTSLTAAYSVETVSTLDAALKRLSTLYSGIVITELTLRDGDGVDLCKAVQAMPRPRLILVSTSVVTRVPKAIAAGCHSVLLKPFAPNLLFARLGRLTRELAAIGAGMTLPRGTNQYWPDVSCTRCGHSGVTSFDAASLRRAWYACLECENVWMARRRA